MNRTSLCLILAATLLTTAACETPEEGLVGEPPAEEMQVANRPAGPRRIKLPNGDDKMQPDKQYPEPIFGAAIWPYIEEGTTFELTWGGPTATLAVHEGPNPNSAIVGEYKIQKGAEIPWRNSWVGVYEPALFVAKTKVEISGTRYAPDNRDLHDAPVSATVHPGQTIAVYHYAGAATCFVGVGQSLMQAPCPSPTNFNGNFTGRTRGEQMHPEKRIWWVFIETQQASGWIPVDDRVLVDILKT
jgi:hypothetical protein